MTVKAFDFDCSRCGKTYPMKPTSAASAFVCSCGHENVVWSLTEIRRRQGLPGYKQSESERIIEMTRSGKLPNDERCVVCHTRDSRKRDIVAICERSWTKAESNGLIGLIWRAAWWIPGIVWNIPLEHLREADENEKSETYYWERFGRDLEVPLPTYVCDGCWQPHGDLKSFVSTIDDYQQLLEEYPGAQLEVALVPTPHECTLEITQD